MKKIFVDENGRKRVQTINSEPSLARQEFKEQCNINNIMKKYHATGMITHLNKKQGQYVDLTALSDFQSAMQTVINAQQSFLTLPSDVRKMFDNDPQKVIEFLSDPKNKDKAIEYGLVKKPVVNEKNELNEKNENDKNTKN